MFHAEKREEELVREVTYASFFTNVGDDYHKHAHWNGPGD